MLSPDTAQIEFPWALPPVTRVHYTPRARLRRRWHRVLRSQAAEDLRPFRAAIESAFWPATVFAGVVVGLAVLVLTRGQYLGWDGLHSIPTGGVR